MKTIEDIARYNAQHADKELPPGKQIGRKYQNVSH
jgi:hypothetical protein